MLGIFLFLAEAQSTQRKTHPRNRLYRAELDKLDRRLAVKRREGGSHRGTEDTEKNPTPGDLREKCGEKLNRDLHFSVLSMPLCEM